jgi:hypothetical protein
MFLCGYWTATAAVRGLRRAQVALLGAIPQALRLNGDQRTCLFDLAAKEGGRPSAYRERRQVDARLQRMSPGRSRPNRPPPHTDLLAAGGVRGRLVLTF